MIECKICKLIKSNVYKYVDNNDIVISDCPDCQCLIGMKKVHSNYPTKEEIQDIINLGSKIALTKYGKNKWYLDMRKSEAPDHYHCHFRKIEENNGGI